MTKPEPGDARLSGFRSRLREAIGNLSVNAFALKCGLAESLLRKYLSGESLPGLEKLVAIADAAGVTVEWLATGQKSATAASVETTDLTHVHVPLFDVTASAGGGGIVTVEVVEDVVSFKRSWLVDELRVKPEDLALVHVEGESMEPTLRPGDLILVNRKDRLVRDGVYLVRIDDAVLVKRLQRLPGGRLEVVSDNPAYKPFTVSLADEGASIAVIGRVIWAGRRM